MTKPLIFASILAALAFSARPAGAQGTLDDYNRAYSLYGKLSSNHVTGWAHGLDWQGDSTVHYYTDTPDGPLYKTYNVATGATGTWTPEERKPEYTFGRPHVPYWTEVDEEKDAYPVLSPDGKLEAYIEGYNLVVHKAGTSYQDPANKRVLSQDGNSGLYYSNRIYWSPDSKKIFVCKRNDVPKNYMYRIESSPADQLQPILHKLEYNKPGATLAQHIPTIFDVETGTEHIADTSLCYNQYEMDWFQWTPDSREVTMEYNQRGHKVYRVLAMDAQTGKMRTVVNETSPTFVNYSRTFRQFIGGGKQLVWMSERDNWCHLYLYDVASGKVIRQITKGPWCVRSVDYIDEQAGKIYFTASGMNPKEDPYLVHYYTINLDGSALTALTPEDGNHSGVYSPDHKYLADTYSKTDKAPVTVIRKTSDGSLVKTLEKADISSIEKAGWTAPITFVAKGRDGKTDIWGIIHRPTNFDPSKKYPVIEYIYAGPGDAYTPKSFNSYYWDCDGLAELGFVVVQLDGFGTSWRGKAFEEVCYKNLSDAGFPDRELWIKAAAKKYKWMDDSKVGIFGASAGGQEALTAVLLHGDFYKAAYSACGCHDNRMDKIWWNEQWMGWPVDSSYVRCSNVANAHLLERPLMIVVGELDDNVDPSSTYQVVNQLIKYNKNFELLVIPGAHHTMGEAFGQHKRYDFFVKNLLGIDPPAWSDVKVSESGY